MPMFPIHAGMFIAMPDLYRYFCIDDDVFCFMSMFSLKYRYYVNPFLRVPVLCRYVHVDTGITLIPHASFTLILGVRARFGTYLPRLDPAGAVCW